MTANRATDAAGPVSGSELHPVAFLEAVLDATTDGVFGVDVAGVVTSWNRSAARIFGWDDADVVGRPAIVLFPADVRPTILWLLDIVATGDRIERYDVDVERRGGMPTPISMSLRPVTVGTEVVGAAVVARDLTEQRLAQASLAETEARRQEGEALTHVGRWLWDIASDTVQWSGEIHRIHGIDPLDFKGDLAAHVAPIVPADRQRVTESLAAAIGQARPFEAEYDILRPDGETRHLYARAEPTLGANGAVMGLRGIIRDTSGPA
jgi:PAS domain S-box-containing protein